MCVCAIYTPLSKDVQSGVNWIHGRRNWTLAGVCRLYTCCYSPCKFVWALLAKILIVFYWSCLRNSHSHILKEISDIHAKGSEVFLHGTWRDSLASWLFALLTNAPNLRLVTAGEVCWRQRWYAKLPKLIDFTWKCCTLLRQKKKI